MVNRSTTTVIRRLVPTLIGTLTVTLVLALGIVSPAAAHTDLLQGSPGPGQRVGGEVTTIDLVFTEPVTEATIRVTFDGRELAGEMIESEGIIIRFGLDEALSEEGRYELEYEMVSFDLDDTIDGYSFDYDRTAPEPIRLGVVVEPEGTNWVVIGASVVLMAAVAGLLLVFVKRIDARRRVETGDDVDAG